MGSLAAHKMQQLEVVERRLAELEKHYKTLCSIASIEVDWLQRLVTGDEAMRSISAILTAAINGER